MKTFITEDFLLNTKAACRLYHDYAENLPIFDYHCHLNPAEIYNNKRFSNVGEAWLAGDHYKWRVMRANAISEEYITGDASYYDKFNQFASIMPGLIGNPIYHWSHLELKRFFDINELFCSDTADQVWETANEILQSTNGTARQLITQSNVRALCTTDDPANSLDYHKMLAEDQTFSVKVLPTFRPDKVLNITDPGFSAYIEKLGNTVGKEIDCIEDVCKALTDRINYFAACGCRLSDHSFGSPDFTIWDEEAAFKAFSKALSRQKPGTYEASAYQSLIMNYLGNLYAEKDFTMQLHIGAIRNVNTNYYRALGADVGCDSIGDTVSASSIAALLDRMAVNDRLPKTILYTLNASDNDKLAAVAGCFQDNSTAGKIQFGSAWWFNDHIDGITSQIKSLANIGVLSKFVGMLTDSRSFLSYPRHEYFRRILCRIIGRWIDDGMIPEDYNSIGKIVEDICFNNVWNYINSEKGE